jgi:hypothetical protein
MKLASLENWEAQLCYIFSLHSLKCQWFVLFFLLCEAEAVTVFLIIQPRTLVQV